MNAKIKWDAEDEDDLEERNSWRRPAKKKTTLDENDKRVEHAKKKGKPFVRRDKWSEESK